MGHRLPLAAAFLIALVAAILTHTTSVSAHAQYKSSTPGKGEIIEVSPARVEITFTQEVQKVSGSYSIDVTRDRGASVATGPADVDDDDRHVMSVPLQSDLEAGRYVVNWTNVSDDDGDPNEGAFSFYIRAQPNAVDLENDRQLDTLGENEPTTPAPQATEAAQTQAASTPATASPTSAADGTGSGDNDDDGDDNAGVIVVIVVAAAALAAAGGYVALSRRGRSGR
ncbi:MAG: copper resistance protein CopC [Dehalococcoidia bacterium]